MLLTSMLGVAGHLILNAKKVRICKGCLYANVSYLMLFMSDIYMYIQI